MIAGSMDFLSPTGAYSSDVLSPFLSGAEEGGAGGIWMSDQVPSPTDSKASADSGVSESLSDNQLLAELFPSDFLMSAEQAITSPASGSGLSPPPVFRQRALKKTPSQNKNAEAARLNRMKKKAYVEGLEKDHAVLKAENLVYKTKCAELKASVNKLDKEVKYLRSVLANQSVLASLIENIPKVKGVQLTSSLFQKRPSGESSDTHPPPAKRSKKTATGGVCLHVSKDVVSLEFCATCSQQAADSA